ncbi:hypothetical protein BC826DRAFT_1030709 [Russula brevipes]|nr:hypothetical protein BC826DRAFT_1030709 [Russula brevipes]
MRQRLSKAADLGIRRDEGSREPRCCKMAGNAFNAQPRLGSLGAVCDQCSLQRLGGQSDKATFSQRASPHSSPTIGKKRQCARIQKSLPLHLFRSIPVNSHRRHRSSNNCSSQYEGDDSVKKLPYKKPPPSRCSLQSSLTPTHPHTRTHPFLVNYIRHPWIPSHSSTIYQLGSPLVEPRRTVMLPRRLPTCPSTRNTRSTSHPHCALLHKCPGRQSPMTGASEGAPFLLGFSFRLFG